MVIKEISSLKKGLLLFFCGMSFFVFGQNTNAEEKQIQNVFNQLVLAYGSAKPAPQLIVLKDKPKLIPPAKYYSSPQPNIKVDAYLFTICRTFGKDSLNALSIVLSHELAHYYSDHTFCSDYAYAIKDKNKSLVPALKSATLNDRISKETEADNKGFFYATASGFSPFNLQAVLIDRIYKEYGLPDVQAGYPTKQERIGIAKSAEERAQFLYGYFKAGLKAMEEKKYDEAITAFGNANGFIPYRENYNNMGVAKVLKALDLKALSKGESDTPKRFQYPLEVDNTSRLSKSRTRSSSDNEKMETLLLDAQNNFENAIRLDPTYAKSHINLACVYDLLGKHISAIAEITEKLPKEQQESIGAKQILAIAYYNANMDKKAEEIWRNLENNK